MHKTLIYVMYNNICNKNYHILKNLLKVKSNYPNDSNRQVNVRPSLYYKLRHESFIIKFLSEKRFSMHFAHSFIMNGKNSHGRIGRKQSKRSGKTSCMRRRVREKIRIHLHFTAFFLPNYDHSKLYGALFVSLHKITPHSCRFPKESHCM